VPAVQPSDRQPKPAAVGGFWHVIAACIGAALTALLLHLGETGIQIPTFQYAEKTKLLYQIE
jgi:hypothetical protein